jgi:hypothetical protein
MHSLLSIFSFFLFSSIWSIHLFGYTQLEPFFTSQSQLNLYPAQLLLIEHLCPKYRIYHTEGEGAVVLREIFEAMQFFGRTTSGDETFFYGLHIYRPIILVSVFNKNKHCLPNCNKKFMICLWLGRRMFSLANKLIDDTMK